MTRKSSEEQFETNRDGLVSFQIGEKHMTRNAKLYLTILPV